MADYKELIEQLKAKRKSVERELVGLDKSIAGLEQAADIEPAQRKPRHVGNHEATMDQITDYLQANPGSVAPEVHQGIDTEYSRSSVLNVLNEMAEQGTVQAEQNGRTKYWSLVA